jgi:hypothetical protein
MCVSPLAGPPHLPRQGVQAAASAKGFRHQPQVPLPEPPGAKALGSGTSLRRISAVASHLDEALLVAAHLDESYVCESLLSVFIVKLGDNLT